jgi:hypothetical protein
VASTFVTFPASFLAAIITLASPGPQVPHLSAVRIMKPPQIDGRLDDAVWATAPATDTFTQQYPFDHQPPSERTLLRVLYDDQALYIGFDCDQIHTPILAHLTRRDRDSESEWVWIQLDSRNDGKSAFLFGVNIAGVLADGQTINQTTFSWDWDENWEARTARTPTGWSAEIRLPLRILRFEGGLPIQSWGMQGGRYIAYRQETDLWSYFPREVAAPITHFGRLEGLQNLHGSGGLELRPFALGFGRRREVIPGTTLVSGYDAGGSGGLDLKWHIAPDLTLDSAFNPDFAQVEADQVILNLTNYEIQLPEKRPLFLEGAEAFSFPLQLFYSRRIGSAPLPPSLPTSTMSTKQLVDVPPAATIYGAAKLVGRLGRDWTVGALSAVTARNEVTVQDQQTLVRTTQLAAPLTAFNVLRIKRELGGSGHIGIIGTGATAFEDNGGYPVVSGSQYCPQGQIVAPGTPCFHDAYVGGIDGLWRSSSGDYVLGGAFVESLTHGGSAITQPDGTAIGPGATSPGGWARIAKEGGKHLLWSAEYTGAGRYLDYNDVGFMPRQNLHEMKASLAYRTLEAGPRTIDTATGLEVSERLNLSGVDLGQLYELNTRARLRNFWSFLLAADFAPARFDDREVGDGTAMERGRYLGGRLELSTDPRRRVFLSLSNQEQVIQGGAFSTSTQATLSFHALPQLDIELLPQLSWSSGEPRYAWQAVTAGGPLLFGKLLAKSVSATLRATYTFTPQLTLQAYGQAFLAAGHYDDIRSAGTPGAPVRLTDIAMGSPVTPAQTADFEEAALNVNVVLRWEYRLGSVAYLVYSRSQVPSLPTASFAPPANLDPRAFSHGASADVLLLKISYWWAS